MNTGENCHAYHCSARATEQNQFAFCVKAKEGETVDMTAKRLQWAERQVLDVLQRSCLRPGTFHHFRERYAWTLPDRVQIVAVLVPVCPDHMAATYPRQFDVDPGEEEAA